MFVRMFKNLWRLFAQPQVQPLEFEAWQPIILPKEKFVSPCPPPTPYERELLEILIEECSEVQQRATKMLRFGVLEVQPGQSKNNAQRLANEYGDVRTVAELCEQAGLLPKESVLEGMQNKRFQLAKYMQTEKSQ